MESVMNPLNIDLILRIVFDHLNEKDLKSCRLVCQQWCENSTPLFHKTAVVRFSLKPLFDGDLAWKTRMKAYFKDCLNYSHRNFIIEAPEVVGISRNLKARFRFVQLAACIFNEIGANVKSLHVLGKELFMGCKTTTVLPHLEMLIYILGSVPNVKELVIQIELMPAIQDYLKVEESFECFLPKLKSLKLNWTGYGGRSRCTTMVQQSATTYLLKAAPNITKLSLIDDNFTCHPKLVSKLILPKKHKNINVLRHLNYIHLETEVDRLKRYVDLGPGYLLKSVDLTVASGDNQRRIQRMLANYGHQLERIGIILEGHDMANYTSWDIVLPSMPKLKEIYLNFESYYTCSSIQQVNRPFNHFDVLGLKNLFEEPTPQFKHNFPSLSLLTIRFCTREERTNEMVDANFSLASTKSIRIHKDSILCVRRRQTAMKNSDWWC